MTDCFFGASLLMIATGDQRSKDWGEMWWKRRGWVWEEEVEVGCGSFCIRKGIWTAKKFWRGRAPKLTIRGRNRVVLVPEFKPKALPRCNEMKFSRTSLDTAQCFKHFAEIDVFIYCSLDRFDVRSKCYTGLSSRCYLPTTAGHGLKWLAFSGYPCTEGQREVGPSTKGGSIDTRSKFVPGCEESHIEIRQTANPFYECAHDTIPWTFKLFNTIHPVK